MDTKETLLEVQNLNAYFRKGSIHAVKNVSMSVASHEVVALIGPSGCGKSTFLRCLNRLHEEVPGTSVTGEVLLNGLNIYGPRENPVEVRTQIGMVFQKPNPFPSMSIFENVVAGLTLTGRLRNRKKLEEVAEKSLRQAALWDEVKDLLKQPGTSLSGGQQQRLCIARTLAVDPPVILMDEPTSALDPISTSKIEELLVELKKSVTILIVTHNMQQALRVADQTAFFYLGDLVEFSPTQELFNSPKTARTAAYLSGRFG